MLILVHTCVVLQSASEGFCWPRHPAMTKQRSKRFAKSRCLSEQNSGPVRTDLLPRASLRFVGCLPHCWTSR